MYTDNKARLNIVVSADVDEKLRLFCVKHRKQLSEVVEATLLHCLSNKHFIEKLTKKEEEIDYPM
jgi:hypothetical protein